jgi:hypothetical protein
VRVFETHAITGEGVEVRRLDFRGAITSGIAPADIIGEDDDDVGAGGGDDGRGQQCQPGEQDDGFHG